MNVTTLMIFSMVHSVTLCYHTMMCISPEAEVGGEGGSVHARVIMSMEETLRPGLQ